MKIVPCSLEVKGVWPYFSSPPFTNSKQSQPGRATSVQSNFALVRIAGEPLLYGYVERMGIKLLLIALCWAVLALKLVGLSSRTIYCTFN